MTDNKPYPDLPPPDFGRARRLGAAYFGDAFTADQMRAYADAACAMRAVEPPRAAIGQLLSEAMDLAVSNGANSISMPDHLVEIAAWLSGVAQAAPASPDAHWWRNRADKIEIEVAQSGSPEAMSCYTKMRQLLDADSRAAPAAVAGPIAWLRNERGVHARGKAVLDPLCILGPEKPSGYTATYQPVYAAPITQAPAVAGPVVAYRISDPNEPELGCWLSEKPGATWCKSEPLVAAALATQPQEAAPKAVPEGWVPCVIDYEGGHPEEVAFGPQIMMDRLKKWLTSYFAIISTHPAKGVPAQGDAEDAARLDWLQETSCDLRSIDMPTGAGDSDVHWIVVEHYMAEPREREIGRSFSDDPRAAIDAARAQQEGK